MKKRRRKARKKDRKGKKRKRQRHTVESNLCSFIRIDDEYIYWNLFGFQLVCLN